MTAILLIAALSLGADTPTIRLPEVVTVAPQPAPAPPAPDAAIKLTPDLLYVIDSDVPILVLESPRGRVKKTQLEGPVRLRGKFVGGTGSQESKTIKGKHVFEIVAAESGPVELLIVPQGSTAEADVKRVSLDVDAGKGPRPPPGSDDETDPLKPKKPEPKPTNTKADAKLVESLTAAITEDAKTYAAWRKQGSPATAKEAVALIGETYGDAVSILSIDDANLKPKTWGELVGRVNAMSLLKKIPTTPALMRTRDAVADVVGKRDSNLVLSDDEFTKIIATFETVSASLKEAAK